MSVAALIPSKVRVRALALAIFASQIVALAAAGDATPAPAPAPQAYETPPALTAAQALPAEIASGTDYQVEDPVVGDGLLNHYRLRSRFGTFEVNGRVLLEIRIREIGALADLERVSKSDAFLGAVGRTAAAPVETAAEVVQHPVGTVTGIPRGVANLLKTYKLKARDATESVEHEQKKKDDAAASSSPAKGANVARAGKSYALKYFGVSAAERRWYAKLGVDPYTTNEPLRAAVKKVAKVDATASFGLRFAGLPAIAGMGVVRGGMDAIWREDPVLIRERNRKFLKSIGVGDEDRSVFEDNVALSPTHQLALLEMLRALDGVGSRGELVQRAIEVASEEEALTLVESVGLLVRLHQKAPLAEVLGGVRLPAARTADGKLAICAGFESVYWTEQVAEGARAIATAYREVETSERQVWLTGTASGRVHSELESLGWKLLERADPH
jgi:hypothetical protein